MKKFHVCHDDFFQAEQAPYLEPPDGYGIVTETVSRCGPISPSQWPFISMRNFKTILFVGDDTPSPKIIQNINDKHMNFETISLQSIGSSLPWRTQLDEFIKRSFQLILDEEKHPILVSSSNTLLVCTIIGCLRRIQGWSISSIIDEFRRYTPEQTISLYKNYVELFDFDLVQIPENSRFLHI